MNLFIYIDCVSARIQYDIKGASGIPFYLFTLYSISFS